MTAKTLARVIKNKKPAIIKEKGAPRYVVLDWDTYRRLQTVYEDFMDEVEDYREVHDPKIQAYIREGTKEYLAGKSRPIEDFLAELDVARDKPGRAKKR